VDNIKYFRGEYDFLSNFYVTPVGDYPSSENNFQAMKSLDPKVRYAFMSPSMTPAMAKRLGRAIKVREDWEQIRDQVMLDIVRVKFRNQQLRSMLLQTSTKYLFEGNNWHDVYWGVCDGHCRTPHAEPEGLNKLGKILEQVRYEIWMGESF